MGASAARNVTSMALPLLEDISPASEMRQDSLVAAPPAAGPFDDGLPPPTKWQVFYWAEVCGAVREHGRGGMSDDAWPPDLAPDVLDLKQMVERGLLAKRRGTWRLRRTWYERLAALKARAAPTPIFERVERPAPDCPTYTELEAYERICRWLDAHPRARSRLPFVGLVALGAEDEEPIDALRAMRRLRLVRHTSCCEWALASTWRARLELLQKGIARALRNVDPIAEGSAPPAPASLCAGLDTWGLNWVVEASADGRTEAKMLPPRLRAELDDCQQDAQALEREIETRWVYDGVPLRIYQAGVRAKGGTEGGKRTKGVSWSYILVNPSLRLLIRRTALGGIMANARLGSECLWRRTPLAALNELDALVRRMWGRDRGRWQVSYAHLAHDVANALLELEQLDRYVSRSRRRVFFDAAQAETERLRREVHAQRGVFGDQEAAGAEDLDELDDLDWDTLPSFDWEAEYADDEELLVADPFAEDGYEWDNTPRPAREAKAALEEPVEQRALTVHRWGTRLSGVAFSQGGPVSFVLYRKDWEGRLKGKRHMEPLWKAAGWDGKAPVTRHEARLVRESIRELRVGSTAGVGESERAALNDPWEFLAREEDVWGSVVGRAEACPGAVDVAWIRRVVPREGESNRSRWDTDPAWRVVQRADFGPAPFTSRRLIRRKQRVHDLQKIDQQLLGLLKTREALLHVDPTGRDISLAVRDVLLALERELVRRGEDFGEAARLRRRDRGLPIERVGNALPFRLRPEDAAVEAERVQTRELEKAIDTFHAIERPRALVDEDRAAMGNSCPAIPGEGRDHGAEPGSALGRASTAVWLRLRSAEIRMSRAFTSLEAAEVACRSARELDRLAGGFELAVAAHSAAEAVLRRLEGTAGPDPSSVRPCEEGDIERRG